MADEVDHPAGYGAAALPVSVHPSGQPITPCVEIVSVERVDGRKLHLDSTACIYLLNSGLQAE